MKKLWWTILPIVVGAVVLVGCGGGGSSSSSAATAATAKFEHREERCIAEETEINEMSQHAAEAMNRLEEGPGGNGETEEVPSDPEGEAKESCASLRKGEEGKTTQAEQNEATASLEESCGPPGTPDKPHACRYFWQDEEEGK
jgi:hypothetical protein